MADKITEAIVGEVFLSVTVGKVIESNGSSRPATVKRTVPILGKDIETRGLQGAVLAALDKARADMDHLVAKE